MDWSYVAGFFDGEGCVHHLWQRHEYYLRVSQVVRDSHVLSDMQSFLKKQKVHSVLRFRPSNKPKHRDVWELSVMAAGNVNRFLKCVLPYLIVKKAEAVVAIRFTDAVLKRKAVKAARIQRIVVLAAKAYRRGSSLTRLSQDHEIAVKTLRFYFRARGVRLRNQREGITAYWAARR